MTSKNKQVKIYAGQDTYTKWKQICRRFSSNTAAFAAMVENYHQEVTMIEINIDAYATVPSHDPYHEGQCEPTGITLSVDIQREFVGVGEEMDQGAVDADVWHQRTLIYSLDQCNEYDSRPCTPNADALDEYLHSDAAQALLRSVIDGYEIDWNGSNHVGRHTPGSESAINELLAAIGQLPHTTYDLYCTSGYLAPVIHEVTAETTDDELNDLAAGWEPTDNEILDMEIIDYITEHRDSLAEE